MHKSEWVRHETPEEGPLERSCQGDFLQRTEPGTSKDSIDGVSAGIRSPKRRKPSSESDIRKANDSAIEQFINDFWQNRNWHSAIGSVGLRAKRFVEGYTGVLYPSMYKNRDYHGNCNRRNVVRQLTEPQLRWRDENYRRQGHSMVARRSHNYYTPAKQQRTRNHPITQGRGWHSHFDSAEEENFAEEMDAGNFETPQDVTDAGLDAGFGQGAPAQGPTGNGSENYAILLCRSIAPKPV
ncbi:hypothetical protein Trydic_g8421 [Trypoxylus dichotomus]